MLNSTMIQEQHPQVAVFSSSNGNLTPFFRLAIMLASSSCKVTFITIKPKASAAELNHISSFFSKHQEIKHIEFDILPFITSSTKTNDPFIINFEAINRSLHHLGSLLSSFPQPLSAIFSDFAVANGLSQITTDLHIPHYIISTTSAQFYSTIANLPELSTAIFSKSRGVVEIPGLAPLPMSSLPPTWLDDSPFNYLLKSYLIPNAQSLPKLEGVILNTFDSFEEETITALKNQRLLCNLPSVFPIGPLDPYELEQDHGFPWLDEQSDKSVVYVSFGNRESMSTDQTRELAKGIEKSRCKFFWALKANEVEKDDDKELQELLGNSFLEKTEGRGKVTKARLNQVKILQHPAIGGFVNQCEWDSVMEAAQEGVPILAWPQHGDQKINAEVVEKAGLGIWVREWGWGGQRLVEGEEIGEMVRKMMQDLNLRHKASKVGEEAKKACEDGGSSKSILMGVIEMIKQANLTR